MSNLRIKNKKLKREIEELKKRCNPSEKNIYDMESRKIVSIGSSMVINPEDEYLEGYMEQCIKQLERQILDGVAENIMYNHSPLPGGHWLSLEDSRLKMLKARIDICVPKGRSEN